MSQVNALANKSQDPNEKKRRELYMGNLAAGAVDSEAVFGLITKLLQRLPAYLERYPNPSFNPIREVRMGPTGTFAFLEMQDELLVLTALKFQNAEFMGRMLQIGRPSGMGMGHSEWRDTGPNGPGLDVTPLQREGLLPNPTPKPSITPIAGMTGLASGIVPNQMARDLRKKRELYVGNLVAGVVTAQNIRDIFGPSSMQMMEYNASLGDAVVGVNMAPAGNFCFIEMQTEELATAAVQVFNKIELCGKQLHVGRPTGVDVGLTKSPSMLAPPAQSTFRSQTQSVVTKPPLPTAPLLGFKNASAPLLGAIASAALCQPESKCSISFPDVIS